MRPDVAKELDNARAKFPQWPTDPLHAVAILNEEVGELNRAILQAVYEAELHTNGQASDMLDAVKEEAVQVAAMAYRFLASIDEYRYVPSKQHMQNAGCAACDRGGFMLGHANTCQKKGGDA